MIPPPSTQQELIEEFGDPTPFILEDGGISPKWQLKILTMITLPAPLTLGWIPPGWSERPQVSRMQCHKLIAAPLLAVYQEIHRQGLWQFLKTFDGCYAWRRQRGSLTRISLHSWGMAVDHNAFEDPQGDTAVDMDSRIVHCFENQGFTWGGRWKAPRTDSMHFQYARNI